MGQTQEKFEATQKEFTSNVKELETTRKKMNALHQLTMESVVDAEKVLERMVKAMDAEEAADIKNAEADEKNNRMMTELLLRQHELIEQDRRLQEKEAALDEKNAAAGEKNNAIMAELLAKLQMLKQLRDNSVDI